MGSQSVGSQRVGHSWATTTFFHLRVTSLFNLGISHSAFQDVYPCLERYFHPGQVEDATLCIKHVCVFAQSLQH